MEKSDHANTISDHPRIPSQVINQWWNILRRQLLWKRGIHCCIPYRWKDTACVVSSNSPMSRNVLTKLDNLFTSDTKGIPDHWCPFPIFTLHAFFLVPLILRSWCSFTGNVPMQTWINSSPKLEMTLLWYKSKSGCQMDSEVALYKLHE